MDLSEISIFMFVSTVLSTYIIAWYSDTYGYTDLKFIPLIIYLY